jgi:exodeoxyribonuclease-3
VSGNACQHGQGFAVFDQPLPHRTSTTSQDHHMRSVCFNCNSIRTRMHQLSAIIDRHAPDIIGLQETKVADDEFPEAEIRALGYEPSFHGQKGHYGVAILSRQKPARVIRGLPGDSSESQRRLIGVELPVAGSAITILNGYFPQGENREHAVKFPGKAQFYAGINELLRSGFSPDQPLILMGDFNVAPADQDIGIGEDARKRWLREGHTSFLPEERAWYEQMMSWGLVDAWRQLNPDTSDRFSWFDYRSKGFEREPKRGLRIDMILVSRALAGRIEGAGIDYDIRGMDRPSDHCPLWLDLRDA